MQKRTRNHAFTGSRCRRGAAMALLMIVTVLHVGCGTSVEEYMSQEPNRVVLRTVSMSGGTNPGAGVYGEIRLEFMMENPDIFIEDDSQSSDEQWKTGIVTDFAVGNEPDVLQFFTDATANQLVAMDKFVTVEEIREVYPDYAADTLDWALELAANADGVSRAVPTTGFWEGLYVNEDLFEEYGLPLPTDSITNEYAAELFERKEAAMFLEGSWYLPGVKDREHTLVLPFPGVPDQKMQPGAVISGMTSGFYITRKAWNDPKKRDAAVRYVMAHTCQEAVQRYYDDGGGAAVAATEVVPPENRSRLAEWAAEYGDLAVKKLLPTDSRMDPQAYQTLIAGISEISLGGSADRLLRRVFEIAEEKGGRNVQGDDY